MLKRINNVIEQSGYNIGMFDDLYDSNIEILNIDYEVEYKAKGDFRNLNNYLNCLSPVFNIEKIEDDKKSVELRYTRVSYFNVYDSIESMVIIFLRQLVPSVEILRIIQESFDKTKEDAEKVLADVYNRIQTERDGKENKKIRIKSNPGCKIDIKTISQGLSEPSKIVSINSVTDLYLLPNIKKFVTALIKLVHNIDTNISDDSKETICKLDTKDDRKRYKKQDDNEQIEKPVSSDLEEI